MESSLPLDAQLLVLNAAYLVDASPERLARLHSVALQYQAALDQGLIVEPDQQAENGSTEQEKAS